MEIILKSNLNEVKYLKATICKQNNLNTKPIFY